MVSITPWMEEFTAAVRATFGERVYCIGLQGSYGRGEAGPDSDIDVVVILDQLSPGTSRTTSPFSRPPTGQRSAGFSPARGAAGLGTLRPLPVLPRHHPGLGSLDDFSPHRPCEDVDRAVCIGACNIYHMCVHNMLHEQGSFHPEGLYKSAALSSRPSTLVTGQYLRRQGTFSLLSPEDRGILEISLALKKRDLAEGELEPLSERLFLWAGL